MICPLLFTPELRVVSGVSCDKRKIGQFLKTPSTLNIPLLPSTPKPIPLLPSTPKPIPLLPSTPKPIPSTPLYS